MAVVTFVIGTHDSRMADVPALDQQHITSLQFRLLVFFVEGGADESLSIETQSAVADVPGQQIGQTLLNVDAPSWPNKTICQPIHAICQTPTSERLKKFIKELRIEVDPKEWVVSRIFMLEASGDTTDIRLSGFELNAGVDEALYKVPADVKLEEVKLEGK